MKNAYFDQALEYLRRFYGYRSFRPAQEAIIESILSGHDTLGRENPSASRSRRSSCPASLL